MQTPPILSLNCPLGLDQGCAQVIDVFVHVLNAQRLSIGWVLILLVCREVLFAWGRLIVFMHYWYILTCTITAGRRIAELATYINVTLIINKFRLKFPEDIPMDYFMMIALSPKRRMNLVFEDLWKSAREFFCVTQNWHLTAIWLKDSVLDETQ